MSLYDKVAAIGGKRYNVYSHENFIESKGILAEDDQTAVEIERDGKTYILPVRSQGSTGTMERPGIYCNGPINFFSFPKTEEDKTIYCPEDSFIFDMSNISDMQQYITEKERFDTSVNKLLETSDTCDDIFTPPLLDTDSGEMRALKECILAKRIDLDKYSERFGENYPNDKRKLKDDNITSFLLKRMCSNLDIEVDMIFRDASDNVPNPMNKTIVVNMVPGNGNNITIKDK